MVSLEVSQVQHQPSGTNTAERSKECKTDADGKSGQQGTQILVLLLTQSLYIFLPVKWGIDKMGEQEYL